MKRKIECPKCHFSFTWNDEETIVECRQCGTIYRLKPANNVPPVLMPGTGRGVVDYLTAPGDRVIANRPILKTYIPKGWEYSCGVLKDRYDLVSNPFVFSICFLSPDHNAKIVFNGESFYKHIDNTPQMSMIQGRLDDLTVSRSPSFRRLRSCMTADEYCDSLVIESGLSRLSLIGESQPDEAEKSVQEKAVKSFISNGFMNGSADWAGRTYSGITQRGIQMKAYAEARVIQLMKLSNVQTMQMMPMGGMFGMRMMPQMVSQQINEVFWETQYDFMIIAAPSAYDNAYREFEKIKKTIEYLPGMQQAREAALALANNALMNISNAQAASFENQQRIINNTQNYTSNIQHQIFESNSASHNKTANGYSEMINDVNSFNGSYGVVMASTQFDNVYQSTRDPDIYAASKGGPFDFGIEFEELKKTDGNY